MSAVIFIPARYASSRYPGKPLVELTGATGEARSLIRRAWDAALSVEGVAAVYVLTDDDRIAEAARGFGAEVLMTAEQALQVALEVEQNARGFYEDVARRSGNPALAELASRFAGEEAEHVQALQSAAALDNTDFDPPHMPE